jgi:antitoxin (DNA-binding transcriptional repressor) of toxin-antitoxin stability system
MESTKVGIREFRQDLADYINAGTPVTITRHGQTVGYFLPAQVPTDTEIDALRKAGAMLDEELAAQGVDVDEVVQEFNAMRKKARAKAA